jgi:hypothetical protein
MASKVEPTLSGDDRPPLRLFTPSLPGPLPPNQTWYDSGPDRHHVAVVPLDNQADALAMTPKWTVLRCQAWFLCVWIEINGAELFNL